MLPTPIEIIDGETCTELRVAWAGGCVPPAPPVLQAVIMVIKQSRTMPDAVFNLFSVRLFE